MATKSLGVCAALLVLAAAPVVAAGAVNVNAASVFGAYAGADAYRLVVASDREGSGGFRAYSICPDGSRLSPLLSRGRPFERIVLSRDGSTVAYQTPPSTHGGIYISRADGSRFHTLALPAFPQAPVLSRDGRLLAFQDVGSTKLWIVGTDGRGLRQLASEGLSTTSTGRQTQRRLVSSARLLLATSETP